MSDHTLLGYLLHNYYLQYGDPNNKIKDSWLINGLEALILLENGDIVCFDNVTSSVTTIIGKEERERGVTEETWVEVFSMRLKKNMKRLNINATQLSEMTGITRTTISRYVNGRSVPSAYVFRKLTEVLHCTTEDLDLFSIIERIK